MNKKNNSCEMFKLLQVKAEKENEQNKLNLLYCDIIKENILESIKQQFKRRYYNISNSKLEFLADTIYYYCVLKLQNIDTETIINFINSENSKYYNVLSEKELSSLRKEANIRYIEYSIKRHTELLERIMDLIEQAKTGYIL